VQGGFCGSWRAEAVICPGGREAPGGQHTLEFCSFPKYLRICRNEEGLTDALRSESGESV
jgi:hypothetical protein